MIVNYGTSSEVFMEEMYNTFVFCGGQF